ncbi:MAG: YncE family protein [Gemmatimonadota bacterium]
MTRTEERLRAALAETAATVREETLRPLRVPRRAGRRWPRGLAPVAAALAAALVIAGVEVGTRQLAGPPPRAGVPGAALTVPAGKQPDSLALDPASGTLYVADGANGTVAMISTAACNAARTSGCGQIRRFRSSAPPDTTRSGAPAIKDMAVNERTRTLYILNRGIPATVAVISMAACNAGTTRGCRGRPALLRLPGLASSLAVNPRTNTLYVTGLAQGGQLYVINASTCDAASLRGCAATSVYSVPRLYPLLGMAVDPATDTLYLGGWAQLLLIDGRTCGAGDVRGCATVRAAAPIDGPAAEIAVGQASGGLYISSTDAGAVTIIDRGTCNAVRTAGCRGPVRAVAGGPYPSGLAADPSAGTVYVTDYSAAVSMITPAGCGGGARGCGQAPASFPVGTTPVAALADGATHTLYVLNGGAGSLSLINTATCNAAGTAGCPRRSPPGTDASAGTQHRNPGYACDPPAVRSRAGLPAGPFIRASVRVAAGSAGGLTWSVWARKGGIRPYSIEQGGLVLNGRWYPLCDAPLSAGPGSNIQVADIAARGVAYGFIQHPQQVAITLRAQGRPLPPPSAVQLPGTTFFISRLPRSACAYRTMTLHAHAVTGPVWTGTTHLTLGPCAAQRPSYVLGTSGSWGPGAGN